MSKLILSKLIFLNFRLNMVNILIKYLLTISNELYLERTNVKIKMELLK